MNRMLEQLPRLSALALAALVGSAHAVSPGVGLTGTTAGAVLGGNATLDITLNLDAPALVDGFDVLFDFDPAKLSFDAGLSTVLGVSWATFAALPDVVADNDASDGQLGLSALLPSTLPVPVGAYPVASLVFKGLALGDQAVSYSLNLVTDMGAGALDGAGSTLVPISAVPEPTPAALLLGGLGVLGWMARRRAA